jgi:hypothetical protein
LATWSFISGVQMESPIPQGGFFIYPNLISHLSAVV